MPIIIPIISASGVKSTITIADPVIQVGNPNTSVFIPPDRNFAWNPGLMSKGGITSSTSQFGPTLSPSGGDDTNLIQTAINSCPAGKFVLLGPGTFLINQTQNPLMISKSGVTLRGSGKGTTIIKKNVGGALPRLSSKVQGTNINTPANQNNTDNAPIIIVGPGRWSRSDNVGGTANLTADATFNTSSITVDNPSLFTVGTFVLLDELSVPSYVATPPGFLNNNTNGTLNTVKVLSGDRVAWNIHTPEQTYQDDPPDAFGWFSRPEPVNANSGSYTDGRVTCEIKEIKSIVGNVITFTSPISITYRTSHKAQITRFTNTPSAGNSVHITNSSVENLTVYLSGGGGIFFNCAAYCWAKNVEVSNCFGLGIQLFACFRCEVRDSYLHTSAQPTPAADSYAICPMGGSSELLIENNIIIDYCKVLAFRSSGAGSVVGYNYTDNGWDWYGTGNASNDAQYAAWMECGINASHMAGPHHVLFEGNYSFNFDSDYTHGNSIYITCFRNWLSGKRKDFTDSANLRCAGGAMFSWWFTFIGNILGTPGKMTGWKYTDSRMGCDINGNNCTGSPTSGWSINTEWSDNAIWKIGYDPERWSCNPDSKTLSTLIRDGNYDYLTNSQKWHNTPGKFTIPNSMYLTSKPSFFGSNPWPWVDPNTGTLYTLPAKARYEAGAP